MTLGHASVYVGVGLDLEVAAVDQTFDEILVRKCVCGVCVCVCMCVHTYVHVHTHTHMHACTYQSLTIKR